MTKFRNLILAGFACFSLITFTGCGDLARSGFRGAAERIGAEMVESVSDEHLKTMFEQANKQCPTRMDQYTMLEEVVLVSDNRAEFRYEVNDQAASLVSQLDKRTMKQNAVRHMKNNPMAVAIAERDLSIEHIYKDKRGNHLLSYTINKDVLAGNLDAMGSEQSNPFSANNVSASTNESVITRPITAPASTSNQPKQHRGSSRSRSNPAGVQGNPFFQN